MRFLQKLIACTYKDIWSHKRTYYNAYSDALRKLYRSRAEVSADRVNIETISAIHEISEHVRAGHFDRSFIENIICLHISKDGMAKIKDSEKENPRRLEVQQHHGSRRFLGPVSRLLRTSRKVEGALAPCDGGGHG